jgi:DUF1365 family protein
MQSCIYEGQVRHTRTKPANHQFDYGLFMMYLDLDELPGLFSRRWLWSASRPALARFRRENHMGRGDQPLSESVRDLVELESGNRPTGPIRLLTNLSYFGYCFNPVSFYYCFDAGGEVVEYIVAEVNNTPWGERDCYVMSCAPADKGSKPWRFSPRKKMHVSPFMPMEIQYDWALTRPGQDLNVFMANLKDGERIFAASLNLQRTEISAGSLSRVLVRFPFQTLKIIFAIHWEAARLWFKRCPVYTHPGKGINSQVKVQ